MAERKILVIDRDADTRAVYRAVLEHAGYRVWEGADGREGHRLALEIGPDLVVCEGRVPLPGGMLVHQAIRRDCTGPAPRILIVTSRGLPTEVDEARASGADQVLVKPVSPMQLLAEVWRLLA